MYYEAYGDSGGALHLIIDLISCSFNYSRDEYNLYK